MLQRSNQRLYGSGSFGEQSGLNRTTQRPRRKPKHQEYINRRGITANYDPYSLIQDEVDAVSKPSLYTGGSMLGFTQKYSKLVNRWFKAEHFYSYIDRPYFQQNDFRRYLEALDL
jgi:hypothetical protein